MPNNNRSILFAMAILSLLLSTAHTAHAVSKTWTGNIGDWSLSSNWTPTGAPTSADDVSIVNSTDIVTVTGAASAASINIVGPAQMKMNSTSATVTLTVSGSGITNSGTISFINNAGNANSASLIVSAGTFTNSTPGVISLPSDTSTGTRSITGLLAHQGTMNVNRSLTLSGGGTINNGLCHVGTGATLKFSSGTYDLVSGAGSATIDGAGSVDFSGGIVNILSNATYSVNGSTSISGSSAVVNFSNTTASTIGLLMSAGTLTGSGMFSASTATWSGGAMGGTGTTNVSGSFSITGTSAKDIYRTVNSYGPAIWTSTGYMYFYASGTFNNQASGTFEAQNDSTLSQAGSGLFNNYGVFKKTVAIGTTTISVPFNNIGNTDAQSGAVAFASGGTSTGSFVASSPTSTLRFSGGTHSISSGATVTAIGTIDFSGGATNILSGATYSVNGITSISGSGASANFSNTTSSTTGLLMSAGTMTGSAIFSTTTATWYGGAMGGTGVTNVNGMFSIAGTSAKDIYRTVNSYGLATWTNTGYMYFYASGMFNNQSSGTFEVQNDSTLSQAGSGLFNNYGAFKKTTATGLTTVSVPFNNTGNTDAQSGAVALASGGTSTGSFVASSPTSTLRFSGGTHSISSGATVTAIGTIDFSGGATNILSGATYSVNGITSISGAVANFSNTTSSTKGLLMSAGTMTGSAIFSTTTATWYGGAMGGTGVTNVTGSFSITGTSAKDIYRTVNSYGPALWTSTGYMYFYASGAFNNQSSGTFEVQNDSTLSQAGSGMFNNYGVFKKTVAIGTTTISVPFNNTGSADTQSGAVALASGGASTGSFVASSPTSTLRFSGGTYNMNSGTTVATGSGVVEINGATASINAAVLSSGSLLLSSGTVTGSGTLTALNMRWTAGTLGGTGSLDIPVSGYLNIQNVNTYKYLDQRTINNSGSTTLTGGFGLSFMNNAAFNNLSGAVFDLQPANNNEGFYNSSGGTFYNNAGALFKKTVTAVSTPINIPFNNDGTIDIEAGTISFTVAFAKSATSILSGTGTIATSVTSTNYGGMAPGLASGGTGTLSFTGALPQGPASSVYIDLGGSAAGSQFDVLAVSGAATLNGTLKVNLVNGYIPIAGQSFKVMTSGSRTGAFVATDFPALPGGRLFNVAYNANDVTLNVTDSVAPTILSTNPSSGEKNIARNTSVSAMFSEPMDAATIGNATFVLQDPAFSSVTGTVSYDAMNRLATFTPSSELLIGKTYTASITTGARDLASNALASNATWTFTTSGLMGGAIQGAPLSILPAMVSTVAGSAAAYGSVDGPGASARFNMPYDVTTDGTSLYLADEGNYTIRKIVIATGAVSTLAGSSGLSGTLDGIGGAARFSGPTGITTDGVNLFVADWGGNTIRKIVIATGEVTTVSGTGSAGYLDGTGLAAMFKYPEALTTDGVNLYVADTGNNRIRKVVIATGIVTTFAGTGSGTGALDGIGTGADIPYPVGITTDGTALYVTDGWLRIRKIMIATQSVSTLSLNGPVLDNPKGMTTDGTNLYVADGTTIKKVDLATGVVTSLAGLSGRRATLDGADTLARFNYVPGIVTDGTDLFVVDANDDTVRKIAQGAFTPPALGEAMDNASLTWTTGGDANWIGQPFTSFAGGDAAVSGAIANNQRTWIETPISGPAAVAFQWKVSSRPYVLYTNPGDQFTFQVDGSPLTSIQGETGWLPYSATVSAGTHTLRWEYYKTGSGAMKADLAWLDAVKVCSLSFNPPMTSLTFTGGSASVAITMNGACPWTATSDSPWITINSGSSGIGSGTVNFTVAAGPQLAGSLTIAGQKYSISTHGTGGLLPQFNVSQGYAAFSGTPGNPAYGSAMAIQPDGKTVVAGQVWNGSEYDILLVRYNLDGALDTTFNAPNGFATFSDTLWGNGYMPIAAAVQPDGRIITAGRSYTTQYEMLVLRFNADGTRDMTFNAPTGYSPATAMALQPDGRIVLSDGIQVFRLNSTGALDTTAFNPPFGMVTYDPTGTGMTVKALAIQNDNKIVAAGVVHNGLNSDIAVYRLLGNGAVDSSFHAPDGYVLFDRENNEAAAALALQPDGKIVIAGTTQSGAATSALAVRFTANGLLDTSTFNPPNGFATLTPAPLGLQNVKTIVIQPDGKLIAALNLIGGECQYAGMVLRFNANGTVDSGFGNNGGVMFFENSANNFDSLGIRPDGSIIAVGTRDMCNIAEALIVALDSGLAAPPAIASTSPLQGATNVPVTTSLSAEFSLPMDEATLDDSTFIVSGPAGTVAGSVVTSGVTATFTPFSNLSQHTVYRAMITTGARDAANGLAMASPQVWSFTTGSVFTISAGVGPHGALSPSGTTSVSYGSTQSYTITPDANYHVLDVLIDGASVGAVTSYTFTNVTANHTISASFTLSDTTPPAFSATSPAANSFVNTAVVGYDLSEAVASGSITFTRTGGAQDASAPHVYALTTPDRTTGPHSIDTGLPLINGAIYTIDFQAADSAGNSSSAVTNANVTYDRTAAAVTITSPLPNAWVNTANVSYTLSESVTGGQVTMTRTSGAADNVHTYTLTTSDMTLGAHTVNMGTLVQGAVYTVAINNVADSAGNSTAPVTSANVTFGAQSVSITNTSPTRKGIITEAAIGYTLSEDAQTGKVTFTRTNGSADADSPHVYAFTTTDLTSGAHTIKTGLSLVDGAYYTVSFEAIDKASNPATTVSNALIFIDRNYGIGPTGNVDNTGSSINLVDNADVAKLRSAMGSRPGDPRWNPVCDLDHNNVIDGSDLMILWSHYGDVQ